MLGQYLRLLWRSKLFQQWSVQSEEVWFNNWILMRTVPRFVSLIMIVVKQTNVGPVLISLNHQKDQRNALTLNSTQAEALQCKQLLRIVHEAVRQQNETGYPQAIILRLAAIYRWLWESWHSCARSGTSGSGKTYSSMIILRQLFNVAGGGPETDAFKHLAAAFTVLRSLGSAKTLINSESSRLVRPLTTNLDLILKLFTKLDF